MAFLFAKEAEHMTHRFEDPWNRFVSTGRIEDYLLYKRHFEALVRHSPAGGNESNEPPTNASQSKHPPSADGTLFSKEGRG